MFKKIEIQVLVKAKGKKYTFNCTDLNNFVHEYVIHDYIKKINDSYYKIIKLKPPFNEIYLLLEKPFIIKSGKFGYIIKEVKFIKEEEVVISLEDTQIKYLSKWKKYINEPFIINLN
jgi:hypothetical protein